MLTPRREAELSYLQRTSSGGATTEPLCVFALDFGIALKVLGLPVAVAALARQLLGSLLRFSVLVYRHRFPLRFA